MGLESEMKKPRTLSKSPPLAAGQLWHLKNGYLQITRVGKTLTEYKMLKQPGQRAVQFQMGNHASVETYLRTNKAKLVAPPC